MEDTLEKAGGEETMSMIDVIRKEMMTAIIGK